MKSKNQSQLKYLANIPSHIMDKWKKDQAKKIYDRAFFAWKNNVIKAHTKAIIMNAKFDKKRNKKLLRDCVKCITIDN
jgi:hypothetical protein